MEKRKWNKEKTEIKKLEIKKDWENIKIPPKTSSENFIILSLAIAGGVLVSKYVF